MTVRLATAIESRESLESAVSMANHRVRFVCVPVLDDDDHDRMQDLVIGRLDELIKRSEAEEVANG